MGKQSLKKTLWQFVFVVASWTIVLVVLFVTIFVLLVSFKGLYPANFPETQLALNLSDLQKSSVTESIDIPSYYDYALYDQSGQLLKTTIANKNSQFLQEALQSGSAQSGTEFFKTIYRKIELDDGTLVLAYQLAADFTSPVLRKNLPNLQVLLIGSFLVFWLLGLVFFSRYFVRKLANKIQVLITITEEIQAMNLDFMVKKTNFKEIDEVIESIVVMRQALKEALEKQWHSEQELMDTLKAISHDIRTPVTVIGGNLELLGETDLTEEQQEYLAYLTSHLARLESYTNQLATISGFEQLAHTEERERLTGKDIISQTELVAQAISQPKNLTVKTEIIRFPDVLITDKVKLDRVIQNILVNAENYSSVNGKLFLNFTTAKEEAVIQIIDQGKGFSATALKKATNRFYTEDDSRTEGKHIGIGLTTAKELVEQLGGHLQIDNQLEGSHVSGAKVTINLPLEK